MKIPAQVSPDFIWFYLIDSAQPGCHAKQFAVFFIKAFQGKSRLSEKLFITFFCLYAGKARNVDKFLAHLVIGVVPDHKIISYFAA